MSTFEERTEKSDVDSGDVLLGDIPPWRGVSVSPTTVGTYLTEKASAIAFDALIDRTEQFKIYREVEGELLQPRMYAEDKTVRIDRIISPKQSLIDAGWKHGPIGIEIKKSSTKIGPPLSQILDYSRAVWHIPVIGFNVVLEYVFLWPVDKQAGTLASIMSQNRIGTCWSISKWTPLAFYVGEERALTFDKEWRPAFGKLISGRRTGTR